MEAVKGLEYALSDFWMLQEAGFFMRREPHLALFF